MVTEKEHQKVINKIKLLISLSAWNTLQTVEYQKYLFASYSCAHCKYAKRIKGCGGSKRYPFGSWCLLWMERKNWLNIKMEEKNEEK
jgi:hypothetical protein